MHMTLRYPSEKRAAFRGKPSKLSGGFLRHWQLYLMILPALLYILLFHYGPMYGITIAFKNFSMRKGILGSPWIGFENFERLFSSYWFPIILRNTLTISLLSLVISFPFPILIALMVNELENKTASKVFQTVSYAPHFISTIVLCGMVVLFLNPSTGMINRLIIALGAKPSILWPSRGCSNGCMYSAESGKVRAGAPSSM